MSTEQPPFFRGDHPTGTISHPPGPSSPTSTVYYTPYDGSERSFDSHHTNGLGQSSSSSLDHRRASLINLVPTSDRPHTPDLSSYGDSGLYEPPSLVDSCTTLLLTQLAPSYRRAIDVHMPTPRYLRTRHPSVSNPSSNRDRFAPLHPSVRPEHDRIREGPHPPAHHIHVTPSSTSIIPSSSNSFGINPSDTLRHTSNHAVASTSGAPRAVFANVTESTLRARESRRKTLATHRCESPGCPQTFPTALNKLRHMDRHTEDWQFKCSCCGKGSKNQSDCKRHEEIERRRLRLVDEGGAKSYESTLKLLENAIEQVKRWGDENALTTVQERTRALNVSSHCDPGKDTIEELSMTSVDFDLVAHYLRSIPVYPMLITVALSHASICVTDASVLARLKQTLDEAIRQYQHQPLLWLICHACIKLHLQRIINITPNHNGCEHLPLSRWFTDGRTIMQVDHDIMSLAKQAANVLENHNLARGLLKKKGQEAQTLLDLLQAVLIHPNTDTRSKRTFRHALVKLATKSGRYPQCLNLRDVSWEAEPFASGGFGNLHRGKVGKRPGLQFAIKVVRVFEDSNLEKLLKAFASEVTVWSHLRHPNILPFMGVFQRERILCIVSPYLKHGNICGYLQKKNPGANRTLLALDTAQAMQFLHGLEPPIVHTDIKGVNVLISDSERACLIDFGFATTKDSLQANVTSTMTSTFSTRWTAPEIIEAENNVGHNAFTAESDMYAFGGVCYEIFFGQVPFHNVSERLILFHIMKGTLPTRIDGQVESSVWAFMEKCWSKEPAARPTAQEAVEFFKACGCVDNRPVVGWDYSILDEC